MGTTDCVHKLLGSVATHTAGVRFRKYAWHHDSENTHGSTTQHRKYCHSNGIVAHTLYGSVQLPDVHHLMGTTDCVH